MAQFLQEKLELSACSTRSQELYVQRTAQRRGIWTEISYILCSCCNYQLHKLLVPLLHFWKKDLVWMPTQENCLQFFSQLTGQDSSKWSNEQKIKGSQTLKTCFTPENFNLLPERHFLGIQAHPGVLATEMCLLLGPRKECSHVD